MSAASVEPARLLRELHELWSGLGREEAGGVLRASVMTLIIVTDGEAGDAPLDFDVKNVFNHAYC